MKKIIIQFIIIFTLLYLLFKYNLIIRNNTLIISLEFIKNVLPSLFPLLIISSFIKENIINKTNNKLIRFISLCLSFMPGNAIVSSNENELLFSSNVNPLFSFILIKSILGFYKSIIIILVNLLINYIFLYKSIKRSNNIYNNDNLSVIEIIKRSSQSLTYIYGTIIVCNIIYTILTNYINPKYLFFIEITNGYKIINSFYKYKLIPIIFLNSFGGLSFFMQIKSIKANTKITFLYKKILLSIFVLILTLIILMTNFIV